VAAIQGLPYSYYFEIACSVSVVITKGVRINPVVTARPISSLNPSSVVAGGSAFTLTVNGIIVRRNDSWNGLYVASTFAAPPKLLRHCNLLV